MADVKIALSADSVIGIKYEPYNTDEYYKIKPGETKSISHPPDKNRGTIWHIDRVDKGPNPNTDEVWIHSMGNQCTGNNESFSGSPKFDGNITWDVCEDEKTINIAVTKAPNVSEPVFADKMDVSAASPSQLWYGDENGSWEIPCKVDNPTKYGMSFSIELPPGDGSGVLVVPHVDIPIAKTIRFDQNISKKGFEGRYAGYVDVDGGEGIIYVVLEEYPSAETVSTDGVLHLNTVPEGASVEINGKPIGNTPRTYRHKTPLGEYYERIRVKLVMKHFKDKEFTLPLYATMTRYYTTKQRPTDGIKGKTKTNKKAGVATFEFQVYNRYSKAPVVEPGLGLTIRNMMNGQTRHLETDAGGIAKASYSYEDDLFLSGKQKLVCSLDGTAERIRSFKSITVSKVTGDARDEDEWHEEYDSDDENITGDSYEYSPVNDAVNNAYNHIGD